MSKRKQPAFTPTPAVAKSTEADAHIRQALQILMHYGAMPGERQKAWVIDQLARILAGDSYEMVVAEATSGEDGPQTYEWDDGVAP